MQSVMNLKIKFRESFRPFAPAVLRERVADREKRLDFALVMVKVVERRRDQLKSERDRARAEKAQVLAHTIEDQLEGVRENGDFPRELADPLLRATDELRTVVGGGNGDGRTAPRCNPEPSRCRREAACGIGLGRGGQDFLSLLQFFGGGRDGLGEAAREENFAALARCGHWISLGQALAAQQLNLILPWASSSLPTGTERILPVHVTVSPSVIRSMSSPCVVMSKMRTDVPQLPRSYVPAGKSSLLSPAIAAAIARSIAGLSLTAPLPTAPKSFTEIGRPRIQSSTVVATAPVPV